MVRLVEQQTNGASLLEQYRASGAPDVFAQIMRAYGGMVFTVCLKVTKDPADAEDASQAVFLTLAVQCKTGAVINYLGPWLKKVAKRTSLDLVRSRKRRTRRETITAENRPEYYRVLPGQQSEHSELQEIIRAELEKLPAKYRMPLVLHYFGGMSHDEISREMKCTTAALGVRLHRARKMLGKRLTARGISLEGAALGAALAATVSYFVSERFIHSTTNAMIAMTAGRPMGMGAMALGSHIPLSLGVVPHLVQEVAQSMARARLRFATLALALSVTMLGGAAEAVRHLPESIRPNLEFLSPSRALENLFRGGSVPRLQDETKPRTVPLALAEVVTPDSDSVQYTTPPMVPLPPTRPQTLMLQMPTITPPVSTHTAPYKPTPQPVPLSQQTTVTPKIVSNPPQPRPESVPLGSTVMTRPATSSAAPSNSASSDSDLGPTKAIPSPIASSSHDPKSRSLEQYVPPPSAFTNTSHNLVQVAGIRNAIAGSSVQLNDLVTSGEFNYVSGATGAITASSSANLAYSTHAQGPVIVTNAGQWLRMDSNDVFVRGGNGKYTWSDTNNGIQPGGVNSVDFTIEGATRAGLLSIERLPVNSTLAPTRPTGHTFIGIWSLNKLMDFDFDQIDLTVHYDIALAEALGLKESVLKLWVYEDSSWIRIMDSTFARDMEHHTLSGSYGSAEYFGVSAPEPTAIFSVTLGIGALLLKRRRRA